MAATVTRYSYNRTLDSSLTETGTSVSAIATVNSQNNFTLTHGTGADQINAIVTGEADIAASGTLSLDLSGGSLTDKLKNSISFTAVKKISIKLLNTDPVADGIAVGGGTNGFFSAALPVIKSTAAGAEGHFEWGNFSAAGVAVVNATNDILQIVNQDSTNVAKVFYEIAGLKA